MTNKQFLIAFAKLHNEYNGRVADAPYGTSRRNNARRLYRKVLVKFCEDNARLEAAEYLLWLMNMGAYGGVEDLVKIFTSIIYEEE
jgi:hypothetical protein